MPWAKLYVADARKLPLPDMSVQTVVTSPPYWGLRDYGVKPLLWDGDPDCTHDWRTQRTHYVPKMWDTKTGRPYSTQTIPAHDNKGGDFCEQCNAWRGSLGLEPTPDLYVLHLTQVMREVWRVLRKDGTLWLNLGDCYAGSGSPGGDFRDGKKGDTYLRPYNRKGDGMKPKDLVGIPWRVAFGLQADGWWLRSDIVWHKVNPMPESVQDRPARAHEYVFLLTKSRKYFYDQEAVRQPTARFGRSGNKHRFVALHGERSRVNTHAGSSVPWKDEGRGRNLRSVWTIPSQPFPGAHFATFPEALVEMCLLAGTSERGCCSKCGTPWKRIVGVSYIQAGQGSNNLARKGTETIPMGVARPYEVRKLKTTRSLGWKPGCLCAQQEPVACTVLDPFMGSGTVGAVAAKAGLNFVGVDLNSDYVSMAAQRIRSVSPVVEVSVSDLRR